MQLKHSLTTFHPYLENFSYCRFSVYFSEKNQTRGQLLEKVARAAIVAFAALSLYDIFTNGLSFKIKLAVHGTLILFISAIALSALLKRILSTNKNKEGEPVHKREESVEDPLKNKNQESEPIEKDAIIIERPIPRRPVPRSLLEDFNDSL